MRNKDDIIKCLKCIALNKTQPTVMPMVAQTLVAEMEKLIKNGEFLKDLTAI